MTAVDTDFIPVRALNQATYCPRLYFLEYVEGLMENNEFVEEGLFLHRRVDDPGLEFRRRREDDAFHTRSVSLSSAKLGISGKIDLVEERDGRIRPIEYKRSAVPTNDAGEPFARENDAVQVAAQALLLEEEFGKPIDEGVLVYLGSKTRFPVLVDSALRQRTLATIAMCRELSTYGSAPAPLPPDLRRRCHGCSLVSVCQPEETAYLSIAPAEPTIAPASEVALPRVIPGVDDGAVLYVQDRGSYVGKRSEHLVVRKDSTEVRRVPIATLRQVVLFGGVQISSEALATLAGAEVPVIFLSAHARFVAALEPVPRKNVRLRSEQHRVFADTSRRLALAKAAVKAKIANQRTLLMRSLRTRADEPARGSDDPAARDLAEMLARVDSVDCEQTLLGIEGQGAAAYFSAFDRMLANRPTARGFDFTARNRRPPRDPVNAALSFAYALLTKDCFSAVLTVGFDPYLGFYHAGRHGRPSLALDLMEEFRAPVADSIVLSLFNNDLLGQRDFLTWRDACHLNDSGRRRFFETYEMRMATEVTHPIFGYRMSWSRMIEVQARQLAAHIRGELPTYAGLTVR